MAWKRTGSVFIAVVAILAGLLLPLGSGLTPAAAVSGSDFDPGYIISDDNFYNGAAMSEAEIQRFLEAQVGSCANSNCLAVYRADTPTRTWGFGTCSTYNGAGGESAARIIFKVQQACNLSAKVILVTLQKEQGLITDRAPSSGVMQKAMGYGCPDTSDCDSSFYGFFNQVFAAGRQLTWYSNPAGSFTSIRIGQANAIRYSPDASCGSRNVQIQNKATAALYYYTPYTPNAAALGNLYGTGDGCSAYGNRNFWRMYNDWFGPATGNPSPFGNLEAVQAGPGTFRVVGWAIDPDTREPVSVHVYVNAVGTAAPADKTRADVGAAYPSSGSNHGFDVTVPATGAGLANVCVYAMNFGAGGPVQLGCRSISALSGDPVGTVNTTTSKSGVTVSGWAIDPDTTGPASVHVYVDAVGVAVLANTATSGIDSAYAPYGNSHGYSKTISATPGAHDVCVYGINIGPGGNSVIGCQRIVVPGLAISEQGRMPTGAVDPISVSKDGIRVSGWAIDPDTVGPIAVHAYVDAAGTPLSAGGNRTDIPADYAAYGSSHGFTATLPAAPGAHTVCLYAINTSGPPAVLSCQSVSVPGGVVRDLGRPPFGNLEAVVPSTGALSVSGWALDPDVTTPIQVHVYVDSTGVAVPASAERPDVAAVYPGLGSGHGFAWSGPVAPGSHTVCVYAINNGAGGHTLLRCEQVNVPGAVAPPVVDGGRTPIGNIESAVRDAGTVVVGGWALDPDTQTPINVHIYVDAVGTAVLANSPRADVNAATGIGGDHGFAATVPIAAGAHTVCAYGINTGAGGNVQLGCIKVAE